MKAHPPLRSLVVQLALLNWREPNPFEKYVARWFNCVAL